MAKKMRMIFGLLCLSFSALAQNDEVFYKFYPWRANNSISNKIADSLNFWKPGKSLPKTILDPDLDWIASNLSQTTSQPKSFSQRKLLIDRIVNPLVLKALLMSGDQRLNQTFDSISARNKYQQIYLFYDIPSMNFSTDHLLKERLHELNSKNKMHTINNNESNCNLSFQNLVNVFADSLNFWEQGTLPRFLFNSQIENNIIPFETACLQEREPLLILEIILDRVSNIPLLKFIAESDNSLINETRTSEYYRTDKDAVLIKYSVKNLAKERLKTLKWHKMLN